MDLESTLRALAPGLVRFCIGILGHADEGEDLAQESLAALVRFWKTNGPPDSPAAFVYLVARRQAGRFRRRWKRFLPLASPDVPSLTTGASGSSASGGNPGAVIFPAFEIAAAIMTFRSMNWLNKTGSLSYSSMASWGHSCPCASDDHTGAKPAGDPRG